MDKMSREEARDVARRLYAEYGMLATIDTLKVRRNGETFERGLLASKADTWAIFAFGTNRILLPGEHRGKNAFCGSLSRTAIQGVCNRCDTTAPETSRQADCYCPTPCGSRFCGAPKYEDSFQQP